MIFITWPRRHFLHRLLLHSEHRMIGSMQNYLVSHFIPTTLSLIIPEYLGSSLNYKGICIFFHCIHRSRAFSFLIHFTRPTRNKRVSFSPLKSPQLGISGTKRLRSKVSTNLLHLLQEI